MVKVVIIGLGPLGRKVVRYAVRRKGIAVVGAVDTDPAKIGRDLGTLSRIKRLGVAVRGDLQSALKGKKADAAILTTVSSIRKLEPQVREIAKHKLQIVSTCEELSFPWRRSKAVAQRVDAICRKAGVTCLGAGVNPGFLMDLLPSILTAVNQDVKRIVVKRFQDAASRRVPFQQKIGAGLTRAEFNGKAADGALRHVGLPESVDMIAHAMGWKLAKSTETLRPIIATRRISSGYRPIEKGMACGVEQIGRGFVGRKEVIRLHFRAAVGEPKSFDSVEIEGEPNTLSVIDGGVNGDIATCAITLNALRSVIAAAPGLKTMLDVPAVTFSQGGRWPQPKLRTGN